MPKNMRVPPLDGPTGPGVLGSKDSYCLAAGGGNAAGAP